MNSCFFAKISKTGAKCLIILFMGMAATGCVAVDKAVTSIKDAVDNIFSEKMTFTVVAPAAYPDTLNIRSVQAEPFKVLSRYGKDYAVQMVNMIETGIANQGYLSVVNRNADAVIIGNINFGKMEKDSYTKSYKSDKGTTYTYYYVKKLTVTGSYSLSDQKKKTIIGDSFNFNFSKEWSSGQSKAEAEADSLTDNQIFHQALDEISKQIIAAISPHQETITRKLESGDKSINLGNKYLVNGRADQAVSIWDQVVEKAEKDKTKAAAYYNIGVVKEARGKHKDAFELFSKANELCPEKELYIQAMTRVEKAERLKDRRDLQLRQLKRQ